MTLEIFYSKLSLKRDSELKGSGCRVAIWVTRNSLIMWEIWRSLWVSSSLSWHFYLSAAQHLAATFCFHCSSSERIWAIWKSPPPPCACVQRGWLRPHHILQDGFLQWNRLFNMLRKNQLLSLSPSWNWKLDRSWSLNAFNRLYGGEVWSWKGSTIIYALFMCTCVKAICFLEVLLRCNIAGFKQISTWVEFRTEHTRQMLLTKWKYDVGESKHKNGIFTVSYINEECCICLFFSY